MHKIQNDTCSCNRQDYSNVNVECFQNEGWKLEQPGRLTEPGLDTVHVVSDIHRLFKKFGKPPHSSTDKESASLFPGRQPVTTRFVPTALSSECESTISHRASRLPVRQYAEHIDWSNKSLLSTAVNGASISKQNRIAIFDWNRKVNASLNPQN